MVVGAAGQLGQTVADVLRRHTAVVALGRADLDLTNATAVRQMVASVQPRAIVNCSGYNNVDQAQTEARTAIAVNALAVRTLAGAARGCEATFVQYSSDFVFDGETERPYTEEDAPNPRSVYAASKLMGEWFARDAVRSYVLRVESLFGGVGRQTSSCDKIVDAIARGGPVRVFVDRVVSPSYAFDVADATHRLIESAAPFGTYHCVNSGQTTWADFAAFVARELDVAATLEPVRMADVPLPAPRPRYCALSNQKLQGVGVPMPEWQRSVRRYLAGRRAAVPQRDSA
jgi:dTDP-4-dehydrorhamnose reductase